MIPRSLALLVTACLAGCVAGAPLTPPPAGVTRLAVAPVENSTGDALVVSGEWYFERLLGQRRRTVPDVVATEIQTTLLDRGFVVAAGGDVPTLKVVLRRFEPDLPQLSWVDVSVTATLVAPDGTVTWSTDRARWLVSTTGSPSMAAAYETAARRVGEGLLRNWKPADAAAH